MKKLLGCFLVLSLLALLVVGVTAAGSADAPVLRPRYPSLSFEGAVQYNVYFLVTSGEIPATEDMGLLTFHERLADGTVDDAVEISSGAELSSNGLYVVHTNGIPAKNLGDTLYFKIYARLSDGSYVYSNIFYYSAMTYAHTVLSSASSSEEKVALVETMLNYGTAAQNYFDYRLDAPMNRVIATDGHLYPEDWSVVTQPTLEAPGVQQKLCTLCGGAALTEEIPQLAVTGLALTTPPAVTEYYYLDTFDPTGMVITATLSDGSTQAVTDYTLDKTQLAYGDSVVTASRGELSVEIPVTVSSYQKFTVSQIGDVADGTAFVVEGDYVGVADEGPSTDKEMLLKDPVTDDLIALRDVSYGTFPSYGYNRGDRVRLIVTVDTDGSVNTPNKRYLSFSSENGEQSDTLVSTGNAVTYTLDNVIEVESWVQMQALFAVGTLPDYSYIRFTGSLYFNRYAGSDGVSVSRVHMNENATGVSAIRPDGSRTASLRDNVMEANLGQDWTGLFFDTVPETGSYPGTQRKGTLTAVYTGGNNYYFQLTVLDESWVDLKAYDNADVITETGMAYYYQGTQIQYDQTQSRRHLNPDPEAAAGGNTLFLDCSSYVNSVYRAAFGVNVMDNTKSPTTANFTTYITENLGASPDVLGYWVNADYTTDSEISQVLTQVRQQLQVGDLLVYRHGQTEGSSGHVYLYIGNDTFLHCTGSSYVYTDDPTQSYDKATTDEKTGGAVQLIEADAIFTDTTHKRYLFKATDSDTVFNFGLLRPMNRGVTPTETAAARMKLRGISMEKSVSLGHHSAVYPAQALTYTLTLTNHSDTACSELVYTETLSDWVSYTTGMEGMDCDGSRLTWSGDLGAGETLTLSYDVTVLDAPGEILVSTGDLNGVALNVLENTISSLTESEISKVSASAQSYAEAGTAFDDPLMLAYTVYREALGVTVSNHTTVLDALPDLIDTTNKTCRTDTALSYILVPDLYGGLDIRSGYTSDPERTRLVMESHLAKGDIILAEYDGIAYVYVYVGDGTLVTADSTTGVCSSITLSDDIYSPGNVLATLIAFDRYAVIRPSML